MPDDLLCCAAAAATIAPQCLLETLPAELIHHLLTFLSSDSQHSDIANCRLVLRNF